MVLHQQICRNPYLCSNHVRCVLHIPVYGWNMDCGLVGWMDRYVSGWVAGLVEGASPFLQALLVDGVIGGVGAVVGFLPLVMVMYFLIALLEDCGYMARATIVLDPIFKRVGFRGKSV